MLLGIDRVEASKGPFSSSNLATQAAKGSPLNTMSLILGTVGMISYSKGKFL